jgi:valyl-tRNA synthetase
MNCRKEGVELAGDAEYSLADRWIQSRLNELLDRSRRAIDTYRFDLYANAVYDFVWHEYCDWYLELTKPLLWNESTSPAALRGTRRTLLVALETLLRAAHPIMPFITEAIWREVAPLLDIPHPTIMLQPFPEPGDFHADPEADAAIEWLKGVVLGVRNIRGEADIKPRQTVDVLFQGGSERDRILAATTEELFKRLGTIDAVRWLDADAVAPPNALALVGDLKVMVPLAGLIDLQAERARLEKEIGRRESEVQRLEGKLANASFVDKAPAEVVDKERDKLTDARSALSTLQQQLAAIAKA